MTIPKIQRALEKAACTEPKDAEIAAIDFMQAIGTPPNKEGTSFESGFYCALPGDDAEEKLVRGWLQEARTLKYQRDKLLEFHPRIRPKTLQQYRAELRKLAERVLTAMEEHSP